MTTFGFAQFNLFLTGLQWTVLLTIAGFIGGALGGLVVALCKTSDNRLLQWLTSFFIEIFRGTPLLMQLFVIYYGIALLDLNLNPFMAVAAGLTLHASAYLGEIWQGAIRALPKGQNEAAVALGMSYWSRMGSVILPQAFKISLPATVGFLVILLKGTSLAAIVGFTELARTGTIVANITYQPLPAYGTVALIYFALCWPLSIMGRKLEKRLAGAA